MFRKALAITIVAAVVGVLGLSLVAAQQAASASRSFSPASVAPGGEVVVTITVSNYGGFGRVAETLPAGFAYVSSSGLDDSQVAENGQEVRFTLQGEGSFTYTVTASSTAGSHSFSGTLTDSNRAVNAVGGNASVTVEAAQQASASRSFSPASVAPGGEVVVTITVSNYGGFGRVAETLPAGFAYVSSSGLDDSQVAENGQEVRFTLQGEGSFTYTVTASSTAGSHSFSGTLTDSNRAVNAVGGNASVTVEAAQQASASRSFSPASVAPGGEVVVTITVSNYGGFGRVAETLPAGFAYVASSLDDSQVAENGQEVRFTLQGEGSFTYTVTASSTAGSHSFSGTLTDSNRVVAAVGGNASVTVEAAQQASASRSFSPASVAPGGEVVVTITVSNYGGFGRVAETLPAGFAYVASSLDDSQVAENGQEVRFTLQGEGSFTYTVTASSTAGSHSFSGTLTDSNRVVAAVGGNASVTVEAAQQASASRSFSPASVAPGGEVVVTITVSNYGGFGRVAETLPTGFAYVSTSDLDDSQVAENGQEVRFTLQGEGFFTYTVTASSTAGSHSFSGTLTDSNRVVAAVGGNASVTVAADAPPDTGEGDTTGDTGTTQPDAEGPSATRALSAASVDAGGQVVVTITADGYGSFGDVAETLPAGFTYVTSDLPADQVRSVGQTVKFALIGGTPPTTFTYTVTASSVGGDYSFMGVFSGAAADFEAFDGIQVGGDSDITVAATTPSPSGPNASRSLSAGSVAAGGEVTVTITADGYGSFGDVAETLPAGFTYVTSDLPADQVTSEGQTVKFALIGATKPTTFTYTVTASSVGGDYSFMGVFSGVDADFDTFDNVEVGGASDITVGAPAGPNASRSFSPASVAPGGRVVVTITADGYGSFGDVAETLPAGFTYVTSDLPADQVTSEGQTVKFALIGGTPPTTFTYTVTASSVSGDYSFMGVFSGVDADFDTFDNVEVGGASDITVGAPAGPNASRSFSPASVAPGGRVVVTITADGYGSFGDVAETLPAGFTYVTSDLPADQVTSEGQTVKFALIGGTPPTTFTYTVTASSVSGDYSFMGVFSGVDAGFDAFDGVQVGGDSSITVRTRSTGAPSRPSAPARAEIPNRAPVFEGSTTSRSVDEASASGTDVGEPIAADDLDRDTLAYTLSGADAALFDIDGSTGQITVGSETTLDYETRSSYEVTVTVSDGRGGTASVAVTIMVTDVDEAPAATPTARPTAEPTARPTAEPTARPTAEPTARPTAEPTARPTAEPTARPTAVPPTARPTAEPTPRPTAVPTARPTAVPPTPRPTAVPPVVVAPTAVPPVVVAPTAVPPTPEPAPTVAPPAPTVTPPAEEAGGLPGWVIPLIIVVVIGGLAAGFVYLRSRRA